MKTLIINGSPNKAIEYAQWMFKKLNAALSEENIILSLETDTIPAINDENAINKVRELTLKLNCDINRSRTAK